MISIHKAAVEDVSAIKRIADTNKQTLGFVTRPSLLFGRDRGWLFVAQSDAVIVGFVHYRHRRDRQTTIYELCVSQECRGQGIGHMLLDAVRDEAQAQGKSYIRLKAILGIAANRFYQQYGFVLIAMEPGKKQHLNVWHLAIES